MYVSNKVAELENDAIPSGQDVISHSGLICFVITQLRDITSFESVAQHKRKASAALSRQHAS